MNPLLIYGGMQLLGGLFGSRSQQRNQALQRTLMARGIRSVEDNYAGRSPFRDAATRAIHETGTDFGQFLDPAMYENKKLAYDPSKRAALAGGAVQRAFDQTQNIDRVANIREALKDFDTESAPVFEANARKIGQKASQFGALGKGTINTELGELGARTNRERNILQNSLIRDSEEAGINDAFRQLAAAQEEERIGQAEDENLYERAYRERDRETGLARSRFTDRLAVGEANRAERAAALARALGLSQVGFSNDPSSAYFLGANMAGGNAQQAGQAAGINWSVLGQLLAQYFGGQGAMGGMGGTPSPYAGPTPNAYI